MINDADELNPTKMNLIINTHVLEIPYIQVFLCATKFAKFACVWTSQEMMLVSENSRFCYSPQMRYTLSI